MMKTHFRNTGPRIRFSTDNRHTTRRVGELVGSFPFLPGPGLGVIDIFLACCANFWMRIEECLPFVDLVFPGPASLRKGAWDLMFSRQFSKIQTIFGKFKES